MNDTPSRGKSGRPVKVTGEDIVRTALASGIDRFTLSGVAKNLGVTVQSVYRRFPSRKHLLEQCIDAVLAGATVRTELDPVSDTWQDIVRVFSDRWWSICLNHPGFSAVVAGYPGDLNRFLGPFFDSSLGCLLSFGWTRPQVLFCASQVVCAAEQMDCFLERTGSRCEGTLEEATRHLRCTTEFIITGLQHQRPEWVLRPDLPGAAGRPSHCGTSSGEPA